MAEPAINYSNNLNDLASRLRPPNYDGSREDYMSTTDNMLIPVLRKKIRAAAPEPLRTNDIPQPQADRPKPQAAVPIAHVSDNSFLKYLSWRGALIAMGCLVFGLGLIVDLQTVQSNHSARAQVSALSNQASSSAASNSSQSVPVPAQQKPSTNAIGSYQVAAGLPKYLKIDKLGVNARVLQTGVTTSGALGTPPNIYDTAWYTGSAQPGQPASQGAVLIDGHVHGPTLPGVFMNLKNLSPGDNLQITRGDNTVFNYVVVKVQNYDANGLDMKNLLSSIDPSKPGLNLITCGGPFDKQSGQYTQRTVVFAVQE